MVVQSKNFNFDIVKKAEIVKRPVGRGGAKAGKYIDLVTAFDIETTKLYFTEKGRISRKKYRKMSESQKKNVIVESIMYIWQWQFGDYCTVIGRTWDEFLDFCKKIAISLPENYKLVTYVHNLSFEFQFLKGIYHFGAKDVFAMDKRKILKAQMHNSIEFRCSWILSNMSLESFLKKMNVENLKLKGNLDYEKVRFPWTPLNKKELDYCINDVKGLVQAINRTMEIDGDTLATIPMTSTGYCRRDAKRALQPYKLKVLSMLPDYEEYKMLREAFRGGDVHANRLYAGEKLLNVKSKDRSSSYPDVILNCEFPMTKFTPLMKDDEGYVPIDYVLDLIKNRHKAVIMRVVIEDVHLKNDWFPCPYLAKDKCRNIQTSENTKKCIFDNGRILKAGYLETTITDVDLRILLKEYDFSNFIILDARTANYGRLPEPFLELVREYYQQKTSLKGIKEKATLYEKFKNKFNALYGMMVQDPCKDLLLFNGIECKPEGKTPESILEKNHNRQFLLYAWGVWVTAWARYRLHQGIWIVGDWDFVYCDTDSVKYFGDYDEAFEEFNAHRREDSIRNRGTALDSKGRIYYLGVFEGDGEYSEFATLGAKKYCYVDAKDGSFHITIAGVDKKKGAEELIEHGKIDAFLNPEGFLFEKGGGKNMVYSDKPRIRQFYEKGHLVKITSNCSLINDTYFLSVKGDYAKLLQDSSAFRKSMEILLK